MRQTRGEDEKGEGGGEKRREGKEKRDETRGGREWRGEHKRSTSEIRDWMRVQGRGSVMRGNDEGSEGKG